jgi:hypothetical protein
MGYRPAASNCHESLRKPGMADKVVLGLGLIAVAGFAAFFLIATRYLEKIAYDTRRMRELIEKADNEGLLDP